jgi:CubicO group peptidase (beta-lactamase class C family)
MQPDQSLKQGIDALVEQTYKPDEPGAAVIVVKEGETVYRMGRGMANLELDVPIQPDMVFRIGSLTKQFTAVAVLMLAEQGKLAVDDPITRFLPDYPTGGRLITVKHLLTHTSGIKSYTTMPEWIPLRRKDFSLQELIDFFKDQLPVSEPGERWAYNNSGYILLGAIIEKVSCLTYEQFLQQNIFEPLGMKDSYYDNPARVIPRRVAGYSKDPDGFRNADYLSMTQPYAAGALLSTVDDLALWDAALYTGKLLKASTLEQAHASHFLSDGRPTAYGYGWVIAGYQGNRFIEHSGGINGFRSHAIRLPDDHIYAAVLSNNGWLSPETLTFKIAALAMGRPYQEPTALEAEPETFTRYEGLYELQGWEDACIRITRRGDQLFWQFKENEPEEISPLSKDEFFFKNNSYDHVHFVDGVDGRMMKAEMLWRTGMTDIAIRGDDPS